MPDGDIPAAARLLAGRYEESMDMLARFWPLEDRVASIGSCTGERAHVPPLVALKDVRPVPAPAPRRAP